MLSYEDIKKIIDAFKLDFYTKPDLDGKFNEQKQSYSDLQISVDKIAKTTAENVAELKVTNSRLKNIEGWIKLSSEKIGIKFKQ